MSAITVIKKPHRAKKSKKDRKHGRGTRKVQKSRFGSYAAMFEVSKKRKLQRAVSRAARLARRAAKRKFFIPGTDGRHIATLDYVF